MNKNILIIDFSILFPSLSLYSDALFKNATFFSTNGHFPELRALQFDPVTYLRCSKLLIQLFNTHEDNQIYWFHDFLYNCPNLINMNDNVTNVSHYSHFDSFHNWDIRFNDYNWFKNGSSDKILVDECAEHFVYDYSWNLLEQNTYDTIIIVFAEDFVPPPHKPLFTLWPTLYQLKYGHSPTYMDTDTIVPILQ